MKRTMELKRFEQKVWLSSPTMHGEEIQYVEEAYKTNWMSTVGENINEVERLIAEKAGCKAGVVTDMEEQYRSAAMYVMISSMEGLPMVLPEAKSFGLPLVSFDIMTGPADIIRDGVNGWLIPDGDLDQMSKKLVELMGSTQSRVQFSDHSVPDMEKFSMEGIVERWNTVMNRN